MSLTVIATLHPAPGQRDALVTEALRAVPAVLAETGCLGYAPHTVGRDGLVIVESWASGDDLRAHGEGAALAAFREASAHLVTADSDVVVARPVELPAGPA